MSQESIKLAGQLGALGLDPMKFLTTTDGFERTLMLVIAKEVADFKQRMDHALAVNIANQVGKLFKK